MAKAKQLTTAELNTAVNTYIATNKIANTNFNATKNNTAGLVDKIGKIFTIEQIYADKLLKFDGDFLEYGRTVEEWQELLQLPRDYEDVADVDALTSAFANYAPNSYSYELGDKVFKITRKFSDLQKAVNNSDEFNRLVMGITNSQNNSVILWKYAVKRQLIGRLADACIDAMNATTATEWDGSSAHNVGDRVKNADGSLVGVVVKAYATTAGITTYEEAVENGYVVSYDLVSTLPKPIDATTGENFIAQLKDDAEIASDVSEGHSLNGNTLGASNLTLILLQGINGKLQVKTIAGAFQKDELAVPAEEIVIPDFGKMTNTGVYAILLDDRAIRLFNNFDYASEQENGAKSFINYFRTINDTAHYSRNAFVKVYKAE